MNQSATLSVVVPVYNGAKFLPRCLDCLLNQSLKNIHVFLVDDGSTDDTLRIATYYESKHTNLSIIKHQHNLGTGMARNAGLFEANTPLIAFLDADDWIDSNAYLEMANEFETADTDIAICGIRTEYNNAVCSTIRYLYPHHNLITGKFALKLLSRVEQQDVFISPMIGNKVFKTDFLRQHSLHFPNSSIYEDDEFMFLSLCYAKNVSLVPHVYQHYFQRETSVTHTFSKQYVDCLLHSFQNIRSRLEKEGLFEIYDDEYFAFFDKCLASFFDTLFSCEQNVKRQRQYISYLLEELLKVFSIQELMAHIEPCRLQRLWL